MNSRNQRLGFTLIELLVVITVISILAGMLLPALQQTIVAPREVACLNSNKQMSLGVTLYAGDYRGLIPPLTAPTWGGDPKRCFFYQICQETLGDVNVLRCPFEWRAPDVNNIHTSYLVNFTPNASGLNMPDPPPAPYTA